MGRRIGLDAISYLTDPVISPAEPADQELAERIKQVRAWRETRQKRAEEWEEEVRLTALMADIERKQKETAQLLEQLRERLRDSKA